MVAHAFFLDEAMLIHSNQWTRMQYTRRRRQKIDIIMKRFLLIDYGHYEVGFDVPYTTRTCSILDGERMIHEFVFIFFRYI